MALRRDVLLFPEGRKRALTFSYDDAVTQDLRFLEMLNRYGLKGTFNINTGLLGQESLHRQEGRTVTHNKLAPEKIPAAYHGHELAVHGLTHLDLAQVPVSTAAYEISADRRNIEEITKTPVRGMAYPFGTVSKELHQVVESCGIEYARTVVSTGTFELPRDFLMWNPTCHHNDPRLFELAEAFLGEEERYDAPKLFYVWGHTYEFDVYDNWERMEQFMERVSGREDIWYAPNIHICDYINASKQLRYSANGAYIFNPTIYDIWLNIGGGAVRVRSGETMCLEQV